MHSYCSAHQTFFWWRSRCRRRGRGLLKLPINKRVGLIILACHVHQRALRSMGFLVIKAVDERLPSQQIKQKISLINLCTRSKGFLVIKAVDEKLPSQQIKVVTK